MHRGVKILMFFVLGVLAVFLVGLLVLLLWNWLMPALFGFRSIGYWQAFGLLILARLLFGGFRGGQPRGRRWRRRVIERWERMTPEEREKFRRGLHHFSEGETAE
jgi:hypothetical protein